MTDPVSTPRSDKQRRLFFLLPLLFFLLVYILPLGARDLLVPDETRYAEIPREMLASGDWIVPRFDGLRYFEKPVLGYWLHAGSIALFGENNFAVRLPSALAVGLSALLVFVLIHRFRRNEGEQTDTFPALLATLVFLSCFEVVGVGNIALLDNIFTFFLTATVTAFAFSTECLAGSGRERFFLVLAGLGCGLAFLTKGFLALAVPVLALAPFLIWQRRFRDLLRMSWLPMVVAVLVSLPWAIAIARREPDFWNYFFWTEHIRRFLSPHAQHQATFWLYFLAGPLLFLPWSFLSAPIAMGVRRLLGEKGPRRRLVRLCLCWLVLPFLFFSASHGKLLTYILPCFPPFAILAALGLDRMLSLEKTRGVRLGIAGVAVFFILLLLAFILSQLTGIGGPPLFSQPWKAMMVVNGLVFLILLCFWSYRSSQGRMRLMLFGLAPMLLFFLIHFTIPDIVLHQSAPGRVLKRHLNQIRADSVVIAGEDAVGAACWFLQNDHVYLLRQTGELGYGLHYKDAAGRLLGIDAARQLIEHNRGKTVIIARAKTMRKYRQALPVPAYQDDSGRNGYVLWMY